MRLAKLGQQVARPLDRTGNQPRKEADIERVVAQMPLGREVAPPDVDQITQRLEGVKADADRQQQREGRRSERNPQQTEQPLQAVGGKVVVFEEKEHRKAERRPRHHHGLPCPAPAQMAQREGARPADQSGEEDQQDQPRVPAHKKVEAEGEQRRPPHPVGQQIIDNADNRQKDRITQRVEEHPCVPPYPSSSASKPPAK